MLLKYVAVMYIVAQLRSIVLIFVIFLSFLVINKDLFVPENQETWPIFTKVHSSVSNWLLKLINELKTSKFINVNTR